MKKYNVKNYIRYKEDVIKTQPNNLEYKDYNRDEIIVKFLPLVENIAKKFATSQQASGVLNILDLIQEGSIGLIAAIDKLDWSVLNNSEDLEKTLKSFLSKRIKGAIRRSIDINRGNIKIPEYKLREFRKNNGKDKIITAMFFNSIFLSTDENSFNDENCIFQIPDNSEKYNIDIINKYLLSIMKFYLSKNEYDILRMSYGLDCKKYSAREIAAILNITGSFNYIRISEMKKAAINKLIENVNPNQIFNYL